MFKKGNLKSAPFFLPKKISAISYKIPLNPNPHSTAPKYQRWIVGDIILTFIWKIFAFHALLPQWKWWRSFVLFFSLLPQWVQCWLMKAIITIIIIITPQLQPQLQHQDQAVVPQLLSQLLVLLLVLLLCHLSPVTCTRSLIKTS